MNAAIEEANMPWEPVSKRRPAILRKIPHTNDVPA